nr:putative ribonuclease H-like domain-containing protein [Tanacetum cinerariifolium]
MKMEPDIDNMSMSEYLEYEAAKERRLWDDVQSRKSPTHYNEVDFSSPQQNKSNTFYYPYSYNIPPPHVQSYPKNYLVSTERMEHDIDQDSSCDQDDNLEDDGDDRETFDMWDITVDDIERIRIFVTHDVPEVIEDVTQPLILKTLHTTPPNEDYVASETKSILDELLEEFGDEILNVTMVDEGSYFNPDKDIEELEKLLANDPQPHYMEIQVYNNEETKFELIECQIVDNCKKSLGNENYNAVPPPYTGNFMSPTLDFFFTCLDELVNKHVIENCKAMSSKEEPKVVRKYDDSPRIKEWVSDDEEEDVNPQIDLQDQGVIDSGYLRHMTWNMSYLTDYEEIDGGYVALGGNPKGGKITEKNHKVKVIRCDNGTKFKNKEMNQFIEMKGILRQFSIARTPQQNRVAERRNRTLIEAARTMLADSKLPTTFWAEAVSTACYVQNKVLVVKPYNKTPYELFYGKTPTLSFMRPFGCPVTILNTIDHLGKFNGKADEDDSIFDFSSDDEDDGAVADMNNLDTTIQIKEEVYSCQPPRFENPDFPDRLYKVEKALYGLHQAPKAWYEALLTYLLDSGFQRGKIKKTLFIKRNKGELTFFLGLQVKQKKDDIFISQDKYVAKILKKFRFTEVKTASSSMETQKPQLKDEDGKEVDIHMYRYLKGQPKLGLWYPKDPPFDLIPYTASDYARASLDTKSTTRGCQFLRCRLISWQCKKQTVVANSTTKAEYVAASRKAKKYVRLIMEMLFRMELDFMLVTQS